MRPLRFGVSTSLSRKSFPIEEWTRTVQKIEKLGYSTVFRSNHFTTTNYDPITLLTSAASVTKTLNIGSLVFAVDFLHPAIYAKAAATLHLLSSGRFEFGMGAGYDQRDYIMTGIPLEPASVRVERLEEALTIIKSMWTQDRTTFHGKHYQLNGIEKAGELPEGDYPKIIVCGGGRKLLTVAGRHADIVGIIARWRGSRSNYNAHEMTTEGIKRKISRVKKAAEDFGRDPDDIEFQMIFPWTEITENPDPLIENLARNLGLSTEDIHANQYMAIGSGSDIRDKVQSIREETGMSYFVFLLRRDQFEEYAESIVKPLTS